MLCSEVCFFGAEDEKTARCAACGGSHIAYMACKKRKRTGALPKEEPLQKEWGGLTEDSLPKKNADLSEENALREEVFSSEDGTSAECAQSEKAERKGEKKK